MTNRFKSTSQIRAGTSTPRDSRRPLDDYETPETDTLALGQFLYLGRTPKILEPAAGSGRMVRALQLDYPGAEITTADIKQGEDFLLRDDRPFPGHIITNPPYGLKLADAFIHKALRIADGKVAFLMQSGFLFGGERAPALYGVHTPELIVLIPWRIRFIIGDGSERPIRSQAYSHLWLVWPERSRRNSNKLTRTVWASKSVERPWH
jgi:hypothetical protein